MINERFHSSLPIGYKENYIDLTDCNFDIKSIYVRLSYKIKPLSSLLGTRWNYHNWIDSFTEKLLGFASFDQFVQNINWKTILANIIIANKIKRIKKNI